MGIYRLLSNGWKVLSDGTLDGNNNDVTNVGSLDTDELTIRWNPDGGTDLQTVIDNAPENARIVGHLKTQVTIPATKVNTKGLTLERLNLKLADNEDDHLLEVTADDVDVEYCKLDGNRTGQSSTSINSDCLKYTAVSGGSVENVFATSGTRHGINVGVTDDVDNSNSETSSGQTIDDVDVTDYGDDGVTTHFAEDIEIDKVFAYDSAGTYVNSSHGVEIDDGSNNATVSNSIARNTKIGFKAQGHGDAQPAQNVTFDSCIAVNPRDTAFEVSEGTQDGGATGDGRHIVFDNPKAVGVADGQRGMRISRYSDVDIIAPQLRGGGIDIKNSEASDISIIGGKIDLLGTATDRALRVHAGASDVNCHGTKFVNGATNGIRVEGSSSSVELYDVHIDNFDNNTVAILDTASDVRIVESYIGTNQVSYIGPDADDVEIKDCEIADEVLVDNSSPQKIYIKNNDMTSGGISDRGGAIWTRNIGIDNATSTEPPNPKQGDEYLDDGTNRGDGNRGYREYDGTAWNDL